MESIIKELWHGNIIPQEDSRTNSPEMKDCSAIWQDTTRTWRKALPMSREKSSRITCSKLKTTECCF